MKSLIAIALIGTLGIAASTVPAAALSGDPWTRIDSAAPLSGDPWTRIDGAAPVSKPRTDLETMTGE